MREARSLRQCYAANSCLSRRRAQTLKSSRLDARLSRLQTPAPIRSRSAEERSFQLPLWSVPLIVAVLYVCLFQGRGALGLAGADEPRYAAIARAMAATGDWVTLRLWGSPWFEKPALYYWIAGAAMRVFGVSESAARLPSALAALLAALAMAWTALRTYGLRAAWFTLLILPSCAGLIGFARAASPDMLFSGTLAAAMAASVEILQKERPGWSARIAFGFFLGAATLAKGPAALILAGGAALLWGLLTRRVRAVLRLSHPLAMAAFCVTALPWYILCSLRNPDFLRIFIWQHNFERYLTPMFEHVQPFWFFGPIVLVGIVPWTPLLYAPAREFFRARSEKKWTDSPACYFACWAAFPVIFFSLSQSKLPGYVLPAIPPLMLLIATGAARGAERNDSGSQVAAASIGCVFPLLIGIASTQVKNFPPLLSPQIYRHAQDALILAIAAGLAIAALALRPQMKGALPAAATLVAALVLWINLALLPRLDPFLSARATSETLQALDPSLQMHLAVYRAPRQFTYGVEYYLNRALPEWTPSVEQPVLVFTNSEGAEEILASGAEVHFYKGTQMPGVLLLQVERASAPGAQTQEPAKPRI